METKASASDIVNFVKTSHPDEESVTILGSGTAYDPEQVLRTGSITFDYATGRGGILKSSAVQLYGPEASGKTTLALSLIAQLHKENPDSGVPYFDSENSLSPEWMQTLGVNLESTPIIYPRHLEDFINMSSGMLRSVKDESIGEIPVFVLDSVATIHSKEVVDSDAEDETSRAKEPRVWAKHMGKLSTLFKETKSVGIFINQARDNQTMYGAKYTYPGGRTLKHAMFLNIFCQSNSSISERDTKTKEKVLHGMECKIEKNKTSGSTGTFKVRWRANEPISRGWGLVDVIELMERRDSREMAKLSHDPETFQSALDNVPYLKGMKWDTKTDEPVSSQNSWSILFWDNILEAILEDEPDFDDKGMSGKSFSSQKAFISFIDKHPALATEIEEYVLETLNLGTDPLEEAVDDEEPELEDEELDEDIEYEDEELDEDDDLEDDEE